VNEFAEYSRFPAAQPAPGDLNVVVKEGLDVFQGRLDGVVLHTQLEPALPQVNIDREQFKRVIVNLVDNAAEAMRDSLVKQLYVETQLLNPETVELSVADSGCGVSREDKERLFLPYFSKKNRGTGLGLAIVSNIVSEHQGRIRVEDNLPVGARFIIELPVLAPAGDSEWKLAGSRA
jgi:two-component system, NtrC family, nitrogen regulation sensor histidine kinase NtrY